MKPMVIKQYETISVQEYLNKIRPYLKDMINNLKNMTHKKFNQQYQITLFLPQIMMKSV